ncbi:MAG: phosphate ABC transporter permease PstA [Xanthomonadales bacterium]|nr:phosphate ABC transporter permease PstA [Gammaproteobacteria bacterium]MBT8053101.1 phosphate ABC transporter permease PstA [Gammaproteobacteria bacterium]NND56247.1 phosphate ABC transporter permease PstA [Xanthomonadales bacterium]NNK52322.1 phosphate ABC transporter permease PstA [Xanthomonadales bacterium]
MTSPANSTVDIVRAGLPKRYARERRFRLMGMLAIGLGLVFVAILFLDIFSKGYTAFQQTYVRIQVHYDGSVIDPAGTENPDTLAFADYMALLKQSLREVFPEVTDRRAKRDLYQLVSPGAGQVLRDRVLANPEIVGTTEEVWVLANDDIDMLVKGHIDRDLPESNRRLDDRSLAWFDRLVDQDAIEKRFNITFFSSGDSRQPEQAGIAGALMGSFYTLLLTLLFSFPLAVGSAIFLEEFAPKNKWTDLIEININNLAAVPSIIFGLLGLAVFINFFGVPRSTPLVGALVLTLMTLPTIIIASRSALKSVPPSIREAAMGIGASPLQTQFHHVLPLAMPGMLTGTIIGMAQALGETAPLLMIGMIAFIVDVPQGFTDPATVLPVQIFLWADSPERAFVERTSAAIMVLLAFLITMNLTAVLLRKRFERRW